MTIPIITFGQMRDQGVRKVVVYCRHYQCNSSHRDERRPLA